MNTINLKKTTKKQRPIIMNEEVMEELPVEIVSFLNADIIFL